MKNTIRGAVLDRESGDRLWSSRVEANIESEAKMIEEVAQSLEGMMQRFGPELERWTERPRIRLSFNFRPGTSEDR